ncbi:MAG: bacillithiol biosynthesis deacetylase BshB1 [Proteobacteria bacterium]|nr:bacillithiol biosynthesis deacetylase BshB1 [Pseudomonadota bacterium]
MIDLLVFSPHPDDAELGCGGSILRAVEAGLTVDLADMTSGEGATRGGTEERQREREAAARMLGLRERLCLNLPDTRLGAEASHRLSLISLIRRARPQVVLAPYWEDRHPDHEAAGRLVREACFYAGVASVGQGEPFRPGWVYHYMIHRPFQPSFVMDISPVWKKKIEVLEAYATQFTEAEPAGNPTALSGPAFMRAHQARCMHFGAMIGVEYGEPFFSSGPLPLNGFPGVRPSPERDDWLTQYKCY